MKIGEKLFILAALLLFLAPLATATTTQINLKTEPNLIAFITILEPKEDYQQIKMYKEFSGNDGKISIVFTDNEHSKFNIFVVLKKNEVRQKDKKFENLIAGGKIDLELYRDGYVIPEPVINETNETEEIPAVAPPEPEVPEEIEESETAPITGDAIADTVKDTTSKAIYYAIGVIVLAGLMIIIIGGKILKKRNEIGNTKAPKNASEVEKELAKAERKIAEAQAEIRKIKNKGKIESVQEKLKKDMEELKRLKAGEDIDTQPKIYKEYKGNEENRPN